MASLLPPEFKVLLRGPLGWFYLVTAIQSIGFGLSLVLTVVYVHDIRHFSVFFATTLLAINAVVGLIVSPAIGTYTDKFGPVRIYLVLVVISVVAEVSWAFADNALWLIATSLVMSATGGAIFGPGTVILARLVPDALRQQSFGTNFMLLNAGIAIGGLVSAAVVNLHKPSTFVGLYLGTAAFSFLGIFPMLRLRSLGGPVSDKELSEEQTREGWREVLRDRRLIHLIVAAVVLLTCGYGSLDAGFSLYVVDQYHLPIRLISVTLVFNTVAIVFTQLYVLRRIHGKSRTRVMALVSAFWAMCWLIVGLATHTSHWVAIISLCVAQVIFALGETLWSPMGPSLVNHIAPEHLRGRYNAAFGVTWGLASVFAPLIAGVFLGSSSAGLWPYVLCAGALAGGVTMLRLRRRLSAEEDGLVVAR